MVDADQAGAVFDPCLHIEAGAGADGDLIDLACVLPAGHTEPHWCAQPDLFA